MLFVLIDWRIELKLQYTYIISILINEISLKTRIKKNCPIFRKRDGMVSVGDNTSDWWLLGRDERE